MEFIDYKKRDTDAIMTYLKNQEGEVEVSDIITKSGADKLRGYPILFELDMHGLLTIVRHSAFGAPEAVRLVK